jgi:sterol desaturase/sphingolipid hydroxylase (fatty acid hydroxylase superfamily)
MATAQGTGVASSVAWNVAFVLRGGVLAAVAAHAVDGVLRCAVRRVAIAHDESVLLAGATMMVHEALYFGFNPLWEAVARWWPARAIQRAGGQAPSGDLRAKTFSKALVSHFVLQPAVIWLGCASGTLPFSFWATPLPPFWLVALQLAACQLFESLLFFLSHRALHSRLLYARIHKVHHEYHQ